jgi:hypothetical protein
VYIDAVELDIIINSYPGVRSRRVVKFGLRQKAAIKSKYLWPGFNDMSDHAPFA